MRTVKRPIACANATPQLICHELAMSFAVKTSLKEDRPASSAAVVIGSARFKLNRLTRRCCLTVL